MAGAHARSTARVGWWQPPRRRVTRTVGALLARWWGRLRLPRAPRTDPAGRLVRRVRAPHRHRRGVRPVNGVG